MSGQYFSLFVCACKSLHHLGMRLGTTSFAYIFNYISLTSEIAAFIFNPRDKTYHLFRFSFCHSVFVCYVCLSVHVPLLCLSIYLSYVCLSVYIPKLCLSICPCTFVMSVYLSMYLSYVCLYVHVPLLRRSICLCTYVMSVYLPLYCLSIYLLRLSM